MISPGNTDPALTKGSDPAKPQRPNATYFRLVAADDVQGPFWPRPLSRMFTRSGSRS